MRRTLQVAGPQASVECPGNGYSPVSILVTGVSIVQDFDPALAHEGTHGYTEDIWKIEVVEGPNTIQWISGQLCTHYWIQRLELSPARAQFRFQSIRPDGNGGHLLSAVGQPGSVCILEASTNMVLWSEVTRSFNASGSVEFSVGIAPGEPKRFFRAVQVPP